MRRHTLARRLKLLTRISSIIFVLTITTICVCAQTTNAIPTTRAASSSNTDSSNTDNAKVGTEEKRYDDAEKKSAPSSALKSATSKPAPQPPQPHKIGNVNFSGSLRLRAESYGWFETPNYEDNYTFGAAVLRLNIGQQREKFDWQIEGEFPLLVNLPTRAVAPAPQGQLGLGANYFAANGKQDGSAVLKQAFVRAKGLFGDKPLTLRAGRFEFVDGSETTAKDALPLLQHDEQRGHLRADHVEAAHARRSVRRRS